MAPQVAVLAAQLVQLYHVVIFPYEPCWASGNQCLSLLCPPRLACLLREAGRFTYCSRCYASTPQQKAINT